MKKTYITATLLAVMGITLNSCDKSENLETPNQDVGSETPINNLKGEYIITLKDGTFKTASLRENVTDENARSAYQRTTEGLTSEVLTIFNDLGLTEEAILSTYGYVFNGFAAKLTQAQYEALKNDARVESISKNYEFSLEEPIFETSTEEKRTSRYQSTPWGIARVGGAKRSYSRTAWVVDTGIDLDHRDLNVDRNRSKSFVPNESADDGNGHGTHVAGTIGAINNKFGVVGVAHGAKLVSIKVLSNRGTGSFAWTISALDYIARNAKRGDVVNMSLGPRSRYTDSKVDAAVRKVANKGIYVVIAAGNSRDNCQYYSPARVNNRNVYTISNMTRQGTLASTSNYGSPVDYAAPGTSILSTWKNGGYRTISGTSMAAPHVAGLLLSGGVRGKGAIRGDKDSRPDPIAHRR